MLGQAQEEPLSSLQILEGQEYPRVSAASQRGSLIAEGSNILLQRGKCLEEGKIIKNAETVFEPNFCFYVIVN